jgi:hypothetical protein
MRKPSLRDRFRAASHSRDSLTNPHQETLRTPGVRLRRPECSRADLAPVRLVRPRTAA